MVRLPYRDRAERLDKAFWSTTYCGDVVQYRREKQPRGWWIWAPATLGTCTVGGVGAELGAPVPPRAYGLVQRAVVALISTMLPPIDSAFVSRYAWLRHSGLRHMDCVIWIASYGVWHMAYGSASTREQPASGSTIQTAVILAPAPLPPCGRHVASKVYPGLFHQAGRASQHFGAIQVQPKH